MQLLGLVRFVALDRDHLCAWEACERFEARLGALDATLIHREDLQMMVLFNNDEAALRGLSDVLEEGQRGGFSVSAGLAQGIRSRATVASSLSGFTEGSIETLFEIAACADTQEIAISPRLSSILQLAAPEFACRFQAVGQRAEHSRIRAPLIMRPMLAGSRSA